MTDLAGTIERTAAVLGKPDNDAKVASLQQLEQLLQSARTATDDDEQSPTSPALLSSSAALVDVLKLALKAGNARVSTAALSCALAAFEGFYSTSLAVQEQRDAGAHAELERTLKHTVQQCVQLPSGILVFLGDSKQNVRELAGKALLALGHATAICHASSNAGAQEDALASLDKLVKEQGLGSKSPKTREQSLLYLAALRISHPRLPLRPWVPLLVGLLEDSDPIVRDCARESTITIFTAPGIASAAQTDLKKELLKQGTRKAVSEVVLRRVLGGGENGSESTASGPGSPDREPVSGTQSPAPRAPAGKGERLLKQPKNLSQEAILANIEAQAIEAAALAPPTEESVVEVVYIASVRDLEGEIAGMQKHFEGKETEHNWQSREKAIFRLRGMIKGEVQKKYAAEFVSALKGLAEGIIKALNSLRTTLAAATCNLISELAVALRHSLDPLLDTLLSACLKLGSLTKKTIAQASQDDVTDLIRYCSYHSKTVPVLTSNMEQKNVQARIYTIGHIRIFVQVHGESHRQGIEQHGNLELLVETVRKALGDANTAVKDTARSIYWQMNEIWPYATAAILDRLDATSRKQLEKANPVLQNGNTAGASGSLAASSGASGTARMSVREMLASKRAAAQAKAQSAPPTPAPARAAPVATPPSERRSVPSPSPSSSRKRESIVSSSSSSPGDGTPKARPTSMYASNGSPRSQASAVRPGLAPRDRTSSAGSLTSPPKESSPLTNTSSPLRPSPVASSLASRLSNLTSMSRRNRDSFAAADSSYGSATDTPTKTSANQPPSPTLFAMAQFQNDYSDMEGITMDMANGVPLPPDTSSDDESMYLPQKVSPVPKGQRAAQHSRPSFISQHALSTPRQTRRNGNLAENSVSDLSLADISNEVEEAVKGRAAQAEQTAHRFFELTEPDEYDNTIAGTNGIARGDVTGDLSGGDTTIIRDAAVPTHDGAEPASTSILGDLASTATSTSISNQDVMAQSGSNGISSGPAVTPLLKKMQDMHLTDSPVHGDRGRSSQDATAVEHHWWQTKANLLIERAKPIDDLPDELLALVGSFDVASEDQPTKKDIVRLARFSRDHPYSESDSDVQLGDPASIWRKDRLFSRLFEGSCSVARTHAQGNEDRIEAALTLLQSLVVNQNTLLGGREGEVASLLLDLRRKQSKALSSASQAVMHLFIQSIEPLYGLATLRSSLVSHLEQHRPKGSAGLDEATASSYGMALKSFGTLFVQLPSEVLEEELERVKDLIRDALNNANFPHLRQAAISSLVKAHLVLEDDARLFEILGGLTKSQIHLCTYLFAREKNGSV